MKKVTDQTFRSVYENIYSSPLQMFEIHFDFDLFIQMYVEQFSFLFGLLNQIYLEYSAPCKCVRHFLLNEHLLHNREQLL